MQGVLAGFATIGIIIGLGFLLAQLKILDATAQGVLTRIAYYVASPALMVTVLGNTDVQRLLSANLIASLASVAVAATIAVLLARLVWKRDGGDTVIAAFCSAYVNAGNLGLPIAAYALGDAALVAPMLLAQLLVLQPSGLAVLDGITHIPTPGISRRRLLLIRLARPLRNPLAVGSLVGLALALTGIKLPVAINAPLTLIGGIAVPCMLLAYGTSLRLGPRPGAGEPPIQVGALVLLKLVVQPIAAYLIGAYAVGLAGHDLLAVTVIAALPTAQNVFTLAMRYERGVILARDTIFVATLLSVPVILGITWLLAS
ncbi:MAG TPA: AEC family transporter [Propionibacteriaceae bacterium]|nr:AEC family transporter [Propionibacteriaceae bacterium]